MTLLVKPVLSLLVLLLMSVAMLLPPLLPLFSTVAAVIVAVALLSWFVLLSSAVLGERLVDGVDDLLPRVRSVMSSVIITCRCHLGADC